jgi:septum formation protein
VTLSVPLVLASRSPRRRRLLEQLGLAFTVQGSPAEERVPEAAAFDEAARAMARQKVRPVAEARPDALVLAADTVVGHDGAMLEKPTDADDARRMLRSLSGSRHRVCTGVALAHAADGREVVFSETTRVRFADLSDDEIDAYVATGEPLDKAGGYGIQHGLGSVFVEGLDGDYFTVVGLPLHRLYRRLRADFADVLSLS